MKPISSRSWRKALSAPRSSLPKIDRAGRVAVVGIGSELLGDDALGLVVARRLAKRTAHRSDFKIIEAGPVPENALGPLRRFQPELVLIIDAADMGLEPGAIQLVDRSQIDGFSASTHTFPLSFIIDFFTSELNCRVELLAVQPAGFDFEAPLSLPVKRSVERLVKYISSL